MYTLYVSFPFDERMKVISKKVEVAAKSLRSGSGCGFGMRDMEFEYKTKQSANFAADRIENILCSYFLEEKSYSVKVV